MFEFSENKHIYITENGRSAESKEKNVKIDGSKCLSVYLLTLNLPNFLNGIIHLPIIHLPFLELSIISLGMSG